jgi:hypothetical protein
VLLRAPPQGDQSRQDPATVPPNRTREVARQVGFSPPDRSLRNGPERRSKEANASLDAFWHAGVIGMQRQIRFPRPCAHELLSELVVLVATTPHARRQRDRRSRSSRVGKRDFRGWLWRLLCRPWRAQRTPPSPFRVD